MISSERALDVSHSFCSDNSLDFSAQSDSVLCPCLVCEQLYSFPFYILAEHQVNGDDLKH